MSCKTCNTKCVEQGSDGQMCMAWTKRDDVEIDIPEKPSGNGFCSRNGATTMTEKEATLKLIEIIGELLYYIPDMGWADSSRFARRLIDIKEGLSNESRQSN